MEDMIYRKVDPFRAIVINPKICKGCNDCVEVCRSDVLLPNVEKGEPPIVQYPDECWFCGCCVEHCPCDGAINMIHPLNQLIGWKRKKTGEYFRIGMKVSPSSNNKPPVY
jgi:NAD-dependent dihydropyrimidine dehydrogenase PreA subunit